MMEGLQRSSIRLFTICIGRAGGRVEVPAKSRERGGSLGSQSAPSTCLKWPGALLDGFLGSGLSHRVENGLKISSQWRGESSNGSFAKLLGQASPIRSREARERVDIYFCVFGPPRSSLRQSWQPPRSRREGPAETSPPETSPCDHRLAISRPPPGRLPRTRHTSPTGPCARPWSRHGTPEPEISSSSSAGFAGSAAGCRQRPEADGHCGRGPQEDRRTLQEGHLNLQAPHSLLQEKLLNLQESHLLLQKSLLKLQAPYSLLQESLLNPSGELPPPSGEPPEASGGMPKPSGASPEARAYFGDAVEVAGDDAAIGLRCESPRNRSSAS